VRIFLVGKVAVAVGATSGGGAWRRARLSRRPRIVGADVRSEERVAVLMNAAVSTYDGLDCALNDAGRGFNSNPEWT
jgi:hypothetical protein